MSEYALTDTATERAQQIAGLRELADFLETHPLINLGSQRYLVYLVSDDELAPIARSASWQKVYEGEYFRLRKTFSGDIVLDVFTDRDKVCRKVVTGQRVVPAQPATEERTEDIVEWVCEDTSLLERAQ